MPGEAKCLGGEQGAPMHPHMVCPPLLDMALGYTPRLGVSHRANTIIEVVLPFTDIGGESTMEEKI